MKSNKQTSKFAGRDWIYRADGGCGVERVEAFFQGRGYAPHRHDTYAIGITLYGVQSFSYRKDICHSVPGQIMVIHPDEIHDGEAGTADGFLYRIVYIEPALIQRALGNTHLPFVRDGVSSDRRLYLAARALLADLTLPGGALEHDDLLLDLIMALQAASETRTYRHRGDFRAASRAREYIHDNLSRNVTLDQLAEISSRDRWSLSRDFRCYFGTSPYRYLTLRRLDLVRRLIACGQSLAETAVIAGFSDQAHMTRQFVKAYGMPPSRWSRIQIPAEILSPNREVAVGLPHIRQSTPP